MRCFYLDTSIWLDIYNKRDMNGEMAKALIDKIIISDELIIYSDFNIIELKRLDYSFNEINIILRVAKPSRIRLVHTTKEQLEEGRMLAKQRNVPLGDVIHAILARDNEAQLVSRDSDFERLADITRAKRPEDLT